MQRRARTYVTGLALAVTLSVGLTACTGSQDESGGEDTKPGAPSSPAPPAEPGRYSTLPEPCGAVGVRTLKKLLPGAEAAPTAGRSSESAGGNAAPEASPYQGKAIVTYDTDRRAGCRWKSSTSLATRHLAVDLERVVSYDPAVSDDKQAQLLYDERAGQAEIPTDGDSSDSDKGGGDDKSGGGDGGGSEKSGSGSNAADELSKALEGSPPPSPSPSPDEDLSPRTLDGIGDNAYIDDQLDTGDSGVHRDITLVFRSANVIATVTYDQWLTDKQHTPDSAELQEQARSVATELATQFDDT